MNRPTVSIVDIEVKHATDNGCDGHYFKLTAMVNGKKRFWAGEVYDVNSVCVYIQDAIDVLLRMALKSDDNEELVETLEDTKEEEDFYWEESDHDK